MNDPSRFMDDDGAAGSVLIRAALVDEPPADLFAKTVVAVAAGAAIAAIPSAVAANTSAKIGVAMVLKWTCVGMVGGVVALAGARVAYRVVVEPERAQPATATPAVISTTAHPVDRAASPETPSPAEVAPSPLEPERGAPPASTGSLLPKGAAVPPGSGSAPRAPAAEDAAMAAEIRVIDDARQGLTGGRAASSLDLLRRNGADRPDRRLAPEALYLEMEASLSLRDQVSARRYASALLERSPNGPHSARAAHILKEP